MLVVVDSIGQPCMCISEKHAVIRDRSFSIDVVVTKAVYSLNKNRYLCMPMSRVHRHRRLGIHFFARSSASAICPGIICAATASRDSAARFSP